MKEIIVHNMTVKLGGRRRSPLGSARRMRLEDYAHAAQLPPPPASVTYAGKALSSLHNILGNDVLGDCVIAGGYHVEGVAVGNANGGTPYVPTAAQVVADYSAIGGYVPGKPDTDQGCDMATAIAYWTKHGFANGTKLVAALKLNPADQHEMQLACWLFENVYMGMELPDAWINTFPESDGFTWGVAGSPDPYNGHCIMAAGYGSAGLTIDTWGLLGTLTWAAAAKYLATAAGGECYALLTPDLLARGQTKAPNGFDWAALVADFNALGGNAPVPAPPAPVGVTLEQAEAWAATGIASRLPLLEQAMQQAARDGLAMAWPRK